MRVHLRFRDRSRTHAACTRAPVCIDESGSSPSRRRRRGLPAHPGISLILGPSQLMTLSARFCDPASRSQAEGGSRWKEFPDEVAEEWAGGGFDARVQELTGKTYIHNWDREARTASPGCRVVPDARDPSKER